MKSDLEGKKKVFFPVVKKQNLQMQFPQLYFSLLKGGGRGAGGGLTLAPSPPLKRGRVVMSFQKGPSFM